MVQCPKCNIQVSELVAMPPELVTKLQAVGEANVPPQVCAGCVNDLKRKANATGGILIAQEKAKEQHRMQLWKSRVSLIKQARMLMSKKLFSDAAIYYEKYLKILEIVFEVKKGDYLKPELFKDTARTTELTVVTSTYWDLLRIYDTHPKYVERQSTIAKQLALFVPLTPIFPDVARKAEIFAKTAKNEKVIKNFLKTIGSERSRCFIATSVFDSHNATEVLILRFYRDKHIRNFVLGRKFIKYYYKISPPIACILDKHPAAKKLLRPILRIMIKCVS